MAKKLLNGVMHWRFDEQAVLSFAGDTPVLAPGVSFVVQNKDTGAPLIGINDQTLDPVPYVTTEQSATPVMWLPSRTRQVIVTGSTVSYEMTSSDVADEVGELFTTLGTLSSTVTSQAAAAAASQSAAEAAAASAAASAAAAAAAGSGTGTGLTPEQTAKLAALSPLDPAPFPGTTLVYEDSVEKFVPGAITSPPPSASSITTGILSIERLPPGSKIVVDYFQSIYGAANAWPSSRPTARTDIVIEWRGPEPGPGNLQSGGDEFKLVLGQP